MNAFQKNGSYLLLAVCLLTSSTGCYRMPTDDDFSLVPTTNNPAVTREKNDGLIPGLGY